MSTPFPTSYTAGSPEEARKLAADKRIAKARFKKSKPAPCPLGERATFGEREVLRSIVAHALAQELRVSVFNGGDEPEIDRSSDVRAILAALAHTDEDRVVLWTPMGQRWGWLSLVYGNAEDGTELISDYFAHPHVEAFVKAVEKWADTQSEDLEAVRFCTDKPHVVHVNRQFIAQNAKDGGRRPVYTVKASDGRTIYARQVEVLGRASLVAYERQLSCGARAWLETRGALRLIGAQTFQQAKGAADA